MRTYKKTRLWLMVGLGLIPFLPVPMAVQVGLAVGVGVLLVILSRVAHDPGAPPPPAARPEDRDP